MKKELCVIVPIYKKTLSSNEMASVGSYINYFEREHIYFVAPAELNTAFYAGNYEDITIVRFHDKYFKSNKSYNKLMLNVCFYQQFEDYRYLLIAQTDAMIVNPQVDFHLFLDSDYDYIGAPWYSSIIQKPFSVRDRIKKVVIRHPEYCKAGNGGFCLRKIDSIIKMLQSDKWYLRLLWHFNEDIYFTYRGYGKLKIADTELSEMFALEENMKDKICEGKIPFAVHAWEKYFSDLDELNGCLQQHLH